MRHVDGYAGGERAVSSSMVTMSGQQVTAKPTVIANEVAKDVLDKLGVKYDQLDALKTLPMEQIQEAARVSSAWLPVRDGGALPRDPFDPDAPGLSAGVPMILANTHDETVTAAAGRTGVLTWGAGSGGAADECGSVFGVVYAGADYSTVSRRFIRTAMLRIVVAAAVAFRAWPGQVIEADRRAADARSQAHTWVYRMDWKVPFSGHWSLHTIDLPFHEFR